MTIPDDILMAFADGELDEATQKMVEAAERDDPEVRRRVAQHRQLRVQLQRAFAPTLEEPVPERLMAAARRAPAASAAPAETLALVVDMAHRRDAKAAAAGSRRYSLRRSTAWGALAASILVGLIAGYFTWHGAEPLVRTAANGQVVAGGQLAESLSAQLSAERKPDQVAIIGLSFRNVSGEYCRTFSFSTRAPASGLACRDGEEWRIRLLVPAREQLTRPDYRMAGSADSPQLRGLVESEMQGEPLTREGEEVARRAGWAKAPTP